eukprot:GHRR01006805.1.p1 GENE.GHRR01006805.1~~GHRR01006805.1.p1  ORF type:complete len:656 (+),score=249.29 GHRR01006805.1:248-2215(+)
MALSEGGGSSDTSYYAILNVSRDATYEEIKKAYKNLAQVFHPDKHTSDELRDKAQEAFAKLQEAYEVLSDPQKRDVYDVYGKEGLVAGLTVGTKLRSTDELRKEWEAFQAQQRRAREEATAQHRGIYICKVDGRGWAHGDWAKLPQIRMVVVQNSLDVSVTDADVALLQGQAALRGNQGSGSVIAGYKRIVTPNDELEASAVLGLRSLLTVTSTRRLGHYTTASLSGTYTWDQGLGLQVTSSRQLTHNSTASLTWVVGPAGASGMALSATHKGTKYVMTGKLDLGLVTSLSSRFTYLLSDNLSLKLTGRFGTSGIDAEVGLSRKFSPTSNVYAGSAIGLNGGTAFKLRYSRAGQVFEFPILLTGDYRDWEYLAAASIIPPLTSFLVMRYVVRPLRSWQRQRTEQQQRKERAEQLRHEAMRAASETALLQPVARRKAAAEAAAGGLVILEAVYGVLHEYRLARAAQQQQQLSAQQLPAQQQQQQNHVQADRQPQQQQPCGEQQHSSQVNGSGSNTSSNTTAHGAENSSSRPEQASSSSKVDEDQQLPPAWLDVTAALQYLVAGGKLELHGGVSKLGLMGFADVAPKSDKELYVAYCYHRQLYEKVVGDTELLRLPGAGEPIVVVDMADKLWAKYRAACQKQAEQSKAQHVASDGCL